jgi:hypothetical protein
VGRRCIRRRHLANKAETAGCAAGDCNSPPRRLTDTWAHLGAPPFSGGPHTWKFHLMYIYFKIFIIRIHL